MQSIMEFEPPVAKDCSRPTRTRVPRQLKATRHARAVVRRRKKLLKKQKHARYLASLGIRLGRASSPSLRVPDRPKDLFARGAVAKRYSNEAVTIDVPATLSLTSNSDDCIALLARMRAVCCENPSRQVFVNHANLQSISPEAGLVLIAEFTRAHAYAPHCIKQCNKPTGVECVTMLRDIGYFRYLPGLDRENWTTQGQTRRFFTHVTQTKIAGQVANKLLSHFDANAHFAPEERKELYKALIDCMDNTLGHAYPDPVSGLRFLYKKWWLLGGCNDETGEIFFVFYDQGRGIPGTIRTRFRDRLPQNNLIFGRTDEQIIIKAVVEGAYSRHQTKERGRGLPQLKAFVDSSAQGELVIVSNQSRCIFRRDCSPISERLPVALPGTLVVWNLKR